MAKIGFLSKEFHNIRPLSRETLYFALKSYRRLSDKYSQETRLYERF
jgi:hypothetical protein